MEIFDYDNILLLPRRCVVESRRECDPSVELGGRQFRIPVVPANMKTVVNDDICARLAREGYFYIQHRFDVDSVAFARTMRDQGSSLFVIGRYLDVLRSVTGVLEIEERVVVCDSEVIDTLLVVPL